MVVFVTVAVAVAVVVIVFVVATAVAGFLTFVLGVLPYFLIQP